MNRGFLVLAAGELVTASRELERWNPREASREDARLVVDLLALGIYRSQELLRKWKGMVPKLDTVKLEAQDIGEGEDVFFPKQNEVHRIEAVYESPDEPGYTRLVFDGSPGGSWFLDAEPTEEFDVILTHS